MLNNSPSLTKMNTILTKFTSTERTTNFLTFLILSITQSCLSDQTESCENQNQTAHNI